MATNTAVKNRPSIRSSKKVGSAPIAKTQVSEVPRATPAEIARLTHAAISWKACMLWQTLGCPVGQDDQIWYQAEAQLKAERTAACEQKDLNGRLSSAVCSAIYEKLASA